MFHVFRSVPACTKYLPNSNGRVQLWDTEVMRRLRNLGGHSNRVSSLTGNNESGGSTSRSLTHKTTPPLIKAAKTIISESSTTPKTFQEQPNTTKDPSMDLERLETLNPR